jgi:hypothetical protein
MVKSLDKLTASGMHYFPLAFMNQLMVHFCHEWINNLSEVGQKDGRTGAKLCPSSRIPSGMSLICEIDMFIHLNQSLFTI